MGLIQATDHILEPAELLDLLRPPIGRHDFRLFQSPLSHRLRAIAGTLTAGLFPGLPDALTAASELLQDPGEYPTDPTLGYIGSHPLWAFCISTAPAARHRLDGLRVVAIVARWVAPMGELDRTNDYREAVERLERLTDQMHLRLVDDLAAALGKLDQSAVEAAAAALQRLQNENLLRQTPAKAIVRLVKRAAEFAGTRLPERGKEEEKPWDGPHVQLFISDDLSGVLQPLPDLDAVEVADPEQDPTPVLLHPTPLAQQSPVLEAEALKESGYLLSTQLAPGSNRSLLPQETVAFCSYLMEVAEDSAEPLARREAALGWMLSLISSGGLSDMAMLVAAEARSDGEHKVTIHPTFASWGGGIPDAERFWKPRSDDQSKNFNTCTDRFNLPIPIRLRTALASVCGNLTPGGRIFRSTPFAIREAADRLLREARDSSLPRLTETRLRLSLPSALFAKTGDPCLSQMVAGSTFGMSGAPLHYFSTTPAALWLQYSEAVREITGQVEIGSWEPAEDDAPQLGAAISSVHDSVIQGVVSDLRNAVLGATQRSPFADRNRQALNALTEYCCWMLVASVAHRTTESLGSLTLRHIDPRGYVILDDKRSDALSCLRVAALPQIVIDQIQALRRMLFEVADTLNDDKDLQSDLRLRAEGRTPFFQLILEDGTRQVLDVSELKKRWLDVRGLPGNIFRSRLRMLLTRQALHSEYIYLQMGHVYNGTLPFGPECGLAILEFIDITAQAVEQALISDGWKVLPAISLRRGKLEWPSPPGLEQNFALDAESEAKELLGEWAATPRDRSDLKKRFSDAVYAECAGWVEAALIRLQAESKGAGTADNPTVVSPKQIADLLESLVKEKRPVSHVLFFMTRLKWTLRKKFRTGGWQGALPPSALWRKFQPPPIGKTHVLAGLLLRRLREWALDIAEDCRDPIELKARLAVILVADGLVDSEERLHALIAMSALSGATDHVQDPTRLLVEWQSEWGKQAVIFSIEASALARRLLKATPSESEPDLAHTLFNILPVSLRGTHRRNFIQRLIDAGSVGVRTLLPGLLWSALRSTRSICLDGERTTQWALNEIAPLSIEDMEAAESLLGEPDAPSPCQLRTTVVMKQYRELTRFLYRHSERGDKQGVPPKRYSECKEFTRRLIDKEDTDPNVRLIARFVLADLRSASRLRIRQVHEHVTTFGARLLHALSGLNLADLEEEQLEEVYNRVLDMAENGTSPDEKNVKADTTLNIDSAIERRTYLSRVSSQLLRFHRQNEEYLADIDLSNVAWRTASAVDGVRIEILTEAEFGLSLQLVEGLVSQGLLSAEEGSYAKSYLRLMFDGGARSGEVNHLQCNDIFKAGDEIFVHIRNSRVGLLKTRSSQRLLNASVLLGTEGAMVLLATRDSRLSEGLKPIAPLFGFAQKGRLTFFLHALRTMIRTATGGRARSLHALRHSFGSKQLLLRLSIAPTASQSVSLPLFITSKLLGHASITTSSRSYSHLAHVSLSHRITGHFPSVRAEAKVLGVRENTLLQQKRRLRRHPTSAIETPNTSVYISTLRDERLPHLYGHLRGVPDKAFRALLQMRLSTDVLRLLNRLPVSNDELTSIVSTLADLKHSRGVQLLEGEQFDQLLSAAEQQGCPVQWVRDLESPRSRLVPASSLQLRRGLDENVRMFKGWSRADLLDAIQAISWPSRTPRQIQLYKKAVSDQGPTMASFKLASTLAGVPAGSGP